MWGLVDIAVCRLQTAAAAPDGDKNTIKSTRISGGRLFNSIAAVT
jgi:hypothetical protein